MISNERLRFFVAIAVSALVATAAGQAPRSFIPAGGGPIETGAVPAGLRSIEPAACGECHEDHVREWESSAHRISFTSRVFVAEYRHRRLASCAQCHAPRGERAMGVDCAACHVRDGVVLNPTVSGRAPHASRVAPELADERAFAACHEFDFDGQPGDRLQRTVSEWTASRHAGTSCQGCHVPMREGRHAHHLPGGLDAALVRHAIAVESASAEIDGGITRVTLVLEADRAAFSREPEALDGDRRSPRARGRSSARDRRARWRARSRRVRDRSLARASRPCGDRTMARARRTAQARRRCGRPDEVIGFIVGACERPSR